MNRLCTRRRRWGHAAQGIAAIAGAAATVTELWIVLFSPHPHAAIRGLAILIMWAALASCSAVVGTIMYLTDSPAIAAILGLLDSNKPPAEPLRLVEGAHKTGS